MLLIITKWKEIKISAKLRFNEIGMAFFKIDKIDATARVDSTSIVVP